MISPVRNSEGTRVDPVPFLVVTAMAFATCYSFGPMYFVALGASMGVAALGSSLFFLAATVVSYHRLVWTARPSRRDEVPVERRLSRFVLLLLAGFGSIVLLALPLVVT